MSLILFLFFFSSDILAEENNSPINPALLYNQTTFNSDTCCWRKLYAGKEYMDAANLIVSYLDNNKPPNKHSLNWHAGQMYAMAHSDELALKYFKRTYSIFYLWFGNSDAKMWYYYATGTIAFIDKDKKTLQAIIDQWNKKFPKDYNFKTLVRLNENWGKGYEIASLDFAKY